MSFPMFVQKFDTAAQLAEELQAFNREEGLPIDFIPTANALRGAERHDLLAGISGALSLAPHIGMKTQRGSGFDSTVSVAKELLKFVKHLHKPSDTRQSWLMPSVISCDKLDAMTWQLASTSLDLGRLQTLLP